MKDTLTPSNLVLFALFVLPGLISMAVYRLQMPTRLPDSGSALVQGLFYSSLNYVLLRLTDGRYIGGYWGSGSYAGAHPNEGDIYISAVYHVDENGKFGLPVPQSAGLHIRKDAYTSIEFFRVPALRDPALNFDQ